MWILPKNYQLSSPYAQDMVESKEDLTLPELNIESSLMWRSKPSPLRTWLPRWKRVSWMPHLCGRILKPCQWSHFETELTSSLAVIRANPLVPQESDLEKKTPDTSGLTSATSSGQLDLFDVSLKMSKDTLVSDSEKSLATWKALVTKLRGEYSQRVKLALLIRESESTSWPTPTVQDSDKATKKMRDNHQNNLTAVVFSQESFPTPTASEAEHCRLGGDSQMSHSLSAKARRGDLLPTPTTRDWKGGYKEEALTRKDGKSRRFDALPNAAIGGVGTDIVSGHLNPDWVEWLMGVPTGWTELDFSETE